MSRKGPFDLLTLTFANGSVFRSHGYAQGVEPEGTVIPTAGDRMREQIAREIDAQVLEELG